MPKADLTHEARLMLNATLLLAGRRDVSPETRLLCALDLSPGAGPAWDLLRGAALAVARMGESHPLKRDLRVALERAIVLARAEGPPPTPPVYTGGALRDYQKDA
jgi:hypothetical protein